MRLVNKYIYPVLMVLCGATCFAATAACAGSFEDGETAYNQHDYKAALEAWQPLAERGDAQAQYKLGVMYDNGFGVKADIALAADWYRRAAVQGDKAAERHYEANNFAYNLGLSKTAQAKPSDKVVVAKEVKAAAKTVVEIEPAAGSAQQSIAPAPVAAPMVVAPVIAAAPVPVIYDIPMMQDQAERGDVQAQLRLGNLYALGKQVPQDYQQAGHWYAEAATQGNALAEEMLGDLYNMGVGVTQSYTNAAIWYRLSAEQGNVHAQVDLGVLYSLGHGVAQDYQEAAQWYKKAALQGDTQAQAALTSLHAAGHDVTQISDHVIAPDTGLL
jgi:TPR repeat protein